MKKLLGISVSIVVLALVIFLLLKFVDPAPESVTASVSTAIGYRL